MADRAIQDLNEATYVNEADSFVLEQNREAKRLTGRVLINYLLGALKAHGGIKSIEKKSTNGLKDTYRITFADTTTFEYDVTNGRGISTIEKTKTDGVNDTYTITYTDNTTSTFIIKNGTDIESLALVSQDGLVDTYAFTMNDGDTFEFSVRNGEKGDPGDATYTWVKYSEEEPTSTSSILSDDPAAWMGIYTGPLEEAPVNWDAYKWIKLKGETGDPGASATLDTARTKIEYQVSDSGTVEPYGTWEPSIPPAAQGKYIWTRVTLAFNTGSEIMFYSVSRIGVDGTGSVVSVNNISPDGNGNITLGAADVGALASTGGTMSGGINMNGKKITGLNSPAAESEPVSLGYANSNFLGTGTDVLDLDGNKIVKLWQNADTTKSEFPAQTVLLSLSGYDFVDIHCKYTAESTRSFVVRFPMSFGGDLYGIPRMGTPYVVARQLVVRSTGVEFYDGYRMLFSETSFTKNNIYAVPWAIYGIKGVN